jgi:hypothetical protein
MLMHLIDHGEWQSVACHPRQSTDRDHDASA